MRRDNPAALGMTTFNRDAKRRAVPEQHPRGKRRGGVSDPPLRCAAAYVMHDLALGEEGQRAAEAVYYFFLAEDYHGVE